MVAAGTTLQGGKYSLDREIGRGGFGITFQATHHFLKHIVVIKTLNEKLRQHPDFPKFERQFQDEARRLATCIHPNIVRISDFFVEAGLPYMVMEYIPGETLGEAYVMAGIPLPEAVATHFIRQIASALEVVHRNGLLHRDIKPDNIILRRGTQEVVLIDFGIAREFNSGVRQTHTGLVSEGYSPIEQYLSSATRSPATDVYGLAATLYTLLTAQVPMPALLRDREKMPSPKELQPQLSAAVNQAVMRGMAIEAKHRPASVADWLKLLPPAIPLPEPSRVPTYAVPTIDLSSQSAPALSVASGINKLQHQVPQQVSHQDAIAAEIKNNVRNGVRGNGKEGMVVNPPEPKSQVGKVQNHQGNTSSKTGFLANFQATCRKVGDRILRPQVFIATGTAMLAASAGFSVVRMMSPTNFRQATPQPLLTQPSSPEAFGTNQTTVTIPSPSNTTNNSNGDSDSDGTRTIRRRSNSEVTQTGYRRRQRSEDASSSNRNGDSESRTYRRRNQANDNRNDTNNSNSDREPTRTPNSNDSNNEGGASQLSGTRRRSISQPTQTQPSPSVVERLRKIRDNRTPTAPKKNPSTPSNKPGGNNSAEDKKTAPLPPPPQAPKNNDVVVPTQEVRGSKNTSDVEVPTQEN